MSLGQLVQPPTAECSQAQSDDTLVAPVRPAADQPGGFGTVDELDGAVVPEQQCFGNVTDGRSAPPLLTPDREQELMLCRCEANRHGLFFAPVQEAAEASAERKEALVVGVTKISSHHLYRATIGVLVASVTVASRRARARRTCFLAMIAAVLGILGGGAAWVLLHLIGLITNVVLFHQWGWTLPSFKNFHPGPILFVEAAAGALVVSLLARWSPVIRGHGIPEAMESVLTRQSRIAPRAAVAKPLSAAVAIGTGGPFGAEGPIIVTGGAFGSLIGQVIRVTPSERKILLACGAAAGMSATFGTPLAAVVLAIELLLFEFSNRAFVPLVVASSIAGAMHAALFGPGPLFHVPPHDYAGLSTLPVFAIIGIACGILAVVICKGLYLLEAGFRRLRLSEFWHPIIGALGFAAIGLVVPRALGVGYDTINDILANRIAVGVLAVLMVAKLVAWWIALGSGTSGGTLAPILLVSGAFGGMLGALVNEIAPGLHVSPGAVALVAMAATFGSATRATFTAIVFAFELTRDYHAILPIMLAAVIADLISGALLDHGLMTEKLARRGLHVSLDYTPDALQTTFVRDTMTHEVNVLDISQTVADARRRIGQSPHSAYPIVDSDRRCVGIISRSDLLGPDADPETPLAVIASTDVVTIERDDTLLTALERIIDEEVEHLPVIDEEQRIVGMCTRTDILRARSQHLSAEQSQQGWHAAWRRRRSSPEEPG
jgi:chloride channel protein, CIC family